MNKTEIAAFFDERAAGWDDYSKPDPAKISRILDLAGIKAGAKILDVGCGTGVLFPYYMKRNPSLITGLDISERMARIARQKYPNSPAEIICGDAETITLPNRYDSIVIFNAFPHFPDSEKLIQNMERHLRPNGRLTIAHSLGQKQINAKHAGSARVVSKDLMDARDLARLMEKGLTVDQCLSDEGFYLVSGFLNL